MMDVSSPAASPATATQNGQPQEAPVGAPKDLRTYLQQLIEHDRNQLVVVEREVEPEFEVTAITDGMRNNPRYAKFPAVLFTNVKGAEVPLLINLHGTYERLALSIDSTLQGMTEEFARREANPIPTKRVERAEAPCKETVWTGADANLMRLPILRHQELDAGRYVTSAVAVARDPASGLLNAGIYRAQLHGPQALGFQVGPYQSGRYIFLAQQDRGEPMQVAMVIGHHPAWLLAGTTNPPGMGGELEVAGGLMQQPLEVVRAETLDLDVPARAEIVIEGIVETDPDSYQQEGPFGEYPKYYTGSGRQPVFKVQAITMRRNPIYVDVFNAHDEHLAIGGLARMGFLLNRVRDVSPNVTGLHLPLSAIARNHAYVSMKKRADGEPHLVAFALLAYSQATKHVFIVDDDIDVTNEPDVLWALATRFQADKDLTIINNSIGSPLNPPTYAYKRDDKGVLETKLIFDCTRPLSGGRQFPEATRIPPEVKARFGAGDYGAPLTARWEAYLRGEG
jgi:2,5-furandicarboxylate decarboxylase 1